MTAGGCGGFRASHPFFNFAVMASINDMIQQLETLRTRIDTVPEVVEWMVHGHRDEILSLNKDQMLLGRNVKGELLGPDYLNDPYFETPEEAETYARMKYVLEGTHKARIEHALNYPDKPRNTPNLIVTGPFQDSMYVSTDSEGFTIGSNYEEAGAIETKYDRLVFGLAPLSKEYFYETYLIRAIRKHLHFER